jgi:quercetin dioxygenase-like cupin family protein
VLDVQRIDESHAVPAAEPQNFTGRVRMQNLAGQGGATKLELLAVHFDAGAHTRPHKHPSEQVLLFARGSGFVQFPGEERQRVEEGGIVVVPAGVVHMHGATEDEAICHVALRAADGPTDWAPANVPEEWRKLVASEGHG